MKKFIVLAVAALSMNAFASKSMVTLSGFDTGDSQDRSLDFSNSTGGSDNAVERNTALNYAYSVTDAIQVGAEYHSFTNTAGGDIADPGDKYVGMGLKVIYNFANQTADTNYLAVGYNTTKSEDSETAGDDEFKLNTWSVDFGHRFSLGTIWGMNFNYSPSATLAFSKVVASDSDVVTEESHTEVSVNFVKFDVLF